MHFLCDILSEINQDNKNGAFRLLQGVLVELLSH